MYSSTESALFNKSISFFLKKKKLHLWEGWVFSDEFLTGFSKSFYLRPKRWSRSWPPFHKTTYMHFYYFGGLKRNEFVSHIRRPIPALFPHPKNPSLRRCIESIGFGHFLSNYSSVPLRLTLGESLFLLFCTDRRSLGVFAVKWLDFLKNPHCFRKNLWPALNFEWKKVACLKWRGIRLYDWVFLCAYCPAWTLVC